MVKKTSIFEKLKHRWKSGAGVRVAADVAAVQGSRLPDVMEGTALVERPPAAPERVPGRKLNGREDAALALGEGFRELSSLVRGVHTRLEDQGERTVALTEEIRALPALGRAQLDLLQQVAAHLERQGAASERLTRTLGDLPELLRGVQGALDRAAVVDERTAGTMDEFRATMERIQGAMGQMVDSSRTQADATVRAVRDQKAEQQRLLDALERGRQRDVQGLVDGLHGSLTETLAESQKHSVTQLAGATERGLGALRQASDEQTERLSRMLADNGKWSQLLVVLGSLLFFALAGILAVLVLR